jgi:hypothetical protein
LQRGQVRFRNLFTLFAIHLRQLSETRATLLFWIFSPVLGSDLAPQFFVSDLTDQILDFWSAALGLTLFSGGRTGAPSDNHQTSGADYLQERTYAFFFANKRTEPQKSANTGMPIATRAAFI